MSLSLCPALDDATGDLCTTAACVTAAADIIRHMDKDVHPCDNFYNFACGNYVRDAIIPDSGNSVSAFNQIQEAVSHEIDRIINKPTGDGAIVPRSAQLVKDFYESECGSQASYRLYL